MAPAKSQPAAMTPASQPITIHLVSQQQPVAQAAAVQLVAAAPVQQAVAMIAVAPATPPAPVVHHPGPIRRGIGKLGEMVARVGWDHVHYPPARPVTAQAVQLVTTSSATPTSAAVYAAPAPPPVPSAQQ